MKVEQVTIGRTMCDAKFQVGKHEVSYAGYGYWQCSCDMQYTAPNRTHPIREGQMTPDPPSMCEHIEALLDSILLSDKGAPATTGEPA